MRRRKYNWMGAALAVMIFTGCAAKKTTTNSSKPRTNESAEADKLLYERAISDLQHNRFELARLSMQTLINTYPDSEYLAKAKLAIADSYFKEGGTTGLTQAVAEYQDFITFFPFLDKASAPRLLDLVNRYPLYSAADRANWMLASIYERNAHTDVASTYYTRLVKEYPLSPLAAEAKAKLVKFGAPVPQPDPTALARMQKEQQTPRGRPGFLKRPGELLKSGPDVSTAARVGTPTLTPQAEDATDTLSPGAGLSVVAAGGGSGGNNGSGTGAYVQTVSPGASDPPAGTSGSAANSGPSAGSNVPSTADASAQDQSAQGGQAATSTNAGQNANGNADPPSQASPGTSQGESSSKKKKSKKQVQLQPQ